MRSKVNEVKLELKRGCHLLLLNVVERGDKENEQQIEFTIGKKLGSGRYSEVFSLNQTSSCKRSADCARFSVKFCLDTEERVESDSDSDMDSDDKNESYVGAACEAEKNITVHLNEKQLGRCGLVPQLYAGRLQPENFSDFFKRRKMEIKKNVCVEDEDTDYTVNRLRHVEVFVMPVCSGGDLTEYSETLSSQRVKSTYENFLSYVRSFVEEKMKCIYETHNLLYLDMKADNILVQSTKATSRDSSDLKPRLYVGDIGSLGEWGGEQDGYLATFKMPFLPEVTTSRLKRFTGAQLHHVWNFYAALTAVQVLDFWKNSYSRPMFELNKYKFTSFYNSSDHKLSAEGTQYRKRINRFLQQTEPQLSEQFRNEILQSLIPNEIPKNLQQVTSTVEKN
jgi:serine/threonine protein kinase